MVWYRNKEGLLPFLTVTFGILIFVFFISICLIVYIPFLCKFDTTVQYKTLIECNTGTTQKLPLAVNHLTPNDPYTGRTAPLTSKHCILYIYSTNIGTEYFKHALHSPFFSLQNAVCFIMLTCLVPVLFKFYIQDVLKLKKNNSGAKELILCFSSKW